MRQSDQRTPTWMTVLSVWVVAQHEVRQALGLSDCSAIVWLSEDPGSHPDGLIRLSCVLLEACLLSEICCLYRRAFLEHVEKQMCWNEACSWRDVGEGRALVGESRPPILGQQLTILKHSECDCIFGQYEFSRAGSALNLGQLCVTQSPVLWSVVTG